MIIESFAKQKYFMSLLEPVYDRLTRYVRAMTPDREDARDILGETVLAAYESFERVDSHESFVFYLFAVARRIHWKWRWKKQFFTPLAIHHNDLEFSGDMPDVLTDVEHMRASLQRLPLKQREAVVLFEISGFSLLEIREIQGGTLSGVKARVARGRRRLADLLTDSELFTKTDSKQKNSEKKEMEL